MRSRVRARRANAGLESRPVVRVLVSATVRTYREAVASAIDARGGFEVVGAVGPREAVHGAKDAAADVVLVDVSEPESLRRIGRIAKALPGVRVVALGVRDAERSIVAYAEAGVAGFILADDSLDDALDALGNAASGDIVCAPAVAAMLLRRLVSLADAAQPEVAETPITPRERQIVELIERGATNKEIAGELHLEVQTVKNHVHNLLKKLGVARRGDAGAMLRRGALGRRKDRT